jgi:FkbM family methyltransferase
VLVSFSLKGMPTPTAPSSILPSQGRIACLLAARRNYLAEVRALTTAKRYVAFYGCGVILGNIVGAWRDLVGRRIDFLCDTDPSKWNKFFFGVTCISATELEQYKDESVVFVTVGNFVPVLDYLAEKGFPCVRIPYKYDLTSSDYLSGENLEKVAAKLEQVRSILADDRSIATFDAILDRFLDADSPPGVMARVCEGDQYFPRDLIRLKPDESFVDAGAYTGDSVCDFLKRTGGKFASIHCFELDAANFKALQSSVSSLPGADRIVLHPAGLWSEPLEVSYSMEQPQSTIGAGSARGHVVRLDDVIGNAPVTFLKMDIEGAELKALEGARKTILANKPTLAICVYHHFKDLWEIPLYIRSLDPEYRIFLRHHTNFEYETVCYAVPNAGSAC